MTIRLRPHHLLCMLTFAGKGYTPEFVSNFEQVVKRIETGCEVIQIVAGPDDICSMLLAEPGCHCHNASILSRDLRAAEAVSGLFSVPIQPGTELNPSQNLLGSLREAFAAGTIRQACEGCQWKSTCDAIAAKGFIEAQLLTKRGLNQPPVD